MCPCLLREALPRVAGASSWRRRGCAACCSRQQSRLIRAEKELLARQQFQHAAQPLLLFLSAALTCGHHIAVCEDEGMRMMADPAGTPPFRLVRCCRRPSRQQHLAPLERPLVSPGRPRLHVCLASGGASMQPAAAWKCCLMCGPSCANSAAHKQTPQAAALPAARLRRHGCHVHSLPLLCRQWGSNSNAHCGASSFRLILLSCRVTTTRVQELQVMQL